jgi:hypothetical protein
MDGGCKEIVCNCERGGSERKRGGMENEFLSV